MKIEIDLNDKEHVAAIAAALSEHEDGLDTISIYGNQDRPFVVGAWSGNKFLLGNGNTLDEAKADLAAKINDKKAQAAELRKQLAELEGATAP